MRKLISSAAFLMLGVGAASTAHAQFKLKGSDTLEDVTKAVINGCTALDGTALNTTMTYAGGGSGSGEAAMIGTPTQQISPMSRELKSTACVAGASELLIGLDGISVVGADQTGGNSESPTAANVCTDAISGGNRTMTVQFGGCTADELAAGACTVDNTDPANPVDKYTFKSWKDVLAMVYGGQNNGTAGQKLTGGARNPAKIDCGSNIRRTLVDSWADIFTNSTIGTAACRTPTCKRLKHAFRRGDLSGTTDAFVGLVGLPAIAPFTTLSAGNVPKVDTNAAVNPFCNAGEKLMNKGDSDYLDMDPIRRIADSLAGSANRQGKEQVSQAYWIVSNPPAAGGGDVREIDDPAAAPANLKPLVALADFSHPAAQNWSFDPNTTNALAMQRASFASFVTGTNAGNAREGLGVVLTIEIPTNYALGTRTYFEATTNPVPQPPVPCTPTKFAPSIICSTCTNVLCPDGSTTTCLLPVDTTVVGTLASPNFNCLSDRAAPAFPPGTGVTATNRDPRVYNLLVVDQNGKVVKDNYTNPNLTLSAARQNRLVSAFFRLHTSEVTNFGGTPTVAGSTAAAGTPSTTNVCNQFTSTDQIGCLVRANPCSIGFAGREANNNSTSFGAQVENVQVNELNIQNFARGLSPAYPIARGLWVNSVKGFAAVTDVPAAGSTPADNERSLLTCFGAFGGPNTPTTPTSLVHTAMSTFGFVPLDASFTYLAGLTDCSAAP